MKTKHIRIPALLLGLVPVFALTACGRASNGSAAAQKEIKEDETAADSME